MPSSERGAQHKFVLSLHKRSITMSFWDTENITHIQELEPLVGELAANLSKRSRDAFRLVFEGDVAGFAYRLLDPRFSW